MARVVDQRRLRRVADALDLADEQQVVARLVVAVAAALEDRHAAGEHRRAALAVAPVAVLEAGPRVLAGLPDHIAESTVAILRDLGVEVLVNERVVEVTPQAVRTASGREVAAQFTVWAAGIRCAAILQDLDGLESNRVNQLVTLPTLATTRDPDIFAIGDCAATEWKGGKLLPPRAQTAHQQASHLVTMVKRRLRGEVRVEHAAGLLEHQLIDGELRYFKRAPSNLFLLGEAARARRAKPVPPHVGPMEVANAHHREARDAALASGRSSVAARHVRVTQSISVHADAVPAGEVVRAWLPYPREIAGQSGSASVSRAARSVSGRLPGA